MFVIYYINLNIVNNIIECFQYKGLDTTEYDKVEINSTSFMHIHQISLYIVSPSYYL